MGDGSGACERKAIAPRERARQSAALLLLSPPQGGARFIYASAARLAVIKAVSTMSASSDVLAMAAVEVRKLIAHNFVVDE